VIKSFGKIVITLQLHMHESFAYSLYQDAGLLLINLAAYFAILLVLKIWPGMYCSLFIFLWPANIILGFFLSWYR